jgi:hypothetical protein
MEMSRKKNRPWLVESDQEAKVMCQVAAAWRLLQGKEGAVKRVRSAQLPLHHHLLRRTWEAMRTTSFVLVPCAMYFLRQYSCRQHPRLTRALLQLKLMGLHVAVVAGPPYHPTTFSKIYK